MTSMQNGQFLWAIKQVLFAVKLKPSHTQFLPFPFEEPKIIVAKMQINLGVGTWPKTHKLIITSYEDYS